jgi:hypothetical protein
MKKLILLLSLAAPLWSFAQSATILPNAVGVPKVSALAACNTTEKGKQVLNTTDNKMYYCNGTNWQEMTGGGFTLPYNGTASSSSPVLQIENTGSGRGIFAKSVASTAIRGESEEFVGVAGFSTSFNGVQGSSISSIGVSGSSSSNTGVFGSSTSGYGGHFAASGNQPTLYVTSSQGEAADFRGNVKIRDELIVDDNKGIVRSNTGTQQKVVRLTGNYGATMNAETYLDGTLNYENFSSIPTVSVGQVSSGTGEFFKVQFVPFNVTATSCQMRVFNPTNSAITFTGVWHFTVIGPE